MAFPGTVPTLPRAPTALLACLLLTFGPLLCASAGLLELFVKTHDGTPAAAESKASPALPPRYIIVGNLSSATDSWTNLWNYSQWAEENPLYEGDVVIFKYPLYEHVVFQLPTFPAFNHCVYDQSFILGNDTAGVGYGVGYVATTTPAYFACGVFGHCEDFDQKVIIQATLGPMVANPVKAPNQIPDPYPFNPPPAVAATAPPPPRVTSGILANIFLSKSAADYSSFYSLITPLVPFLEAQAQVEPFTLLAPRNDVIEEYLDTLEMELAFLPDNITQGYFLLALVSFHSIPKFYTAAQLKNLGASIPTLLGEPLHHPSRSLEFIGSPGEPYGNGSIVSPDLQTKGTASKAAVVQYISVQGIDGLLIPTNISALIPTQYLKYITFGKNPPLPKVKITPSLSTELNVNIPTSPFAQLSALLFSNFSSYVNNSQWDLWPYIASQGGVTMVMPADTAFADPWWTLLDALVKHTVSKATLDAWHRNIVYFSTLQGFINSVGLSEASANVGKPTLLPPTVLYFFSNFGVNSWYPNKGAPATNATCNSYPDLQNPSDNLISIQGTNRILLAENKTRMVPPSARAVSFHYPPSPPPPSPPSPPPHPPPSASALSPSGAPSPSSGTPSPPPPGAGHPVHGHARLLVPLAAAVVALLIS